MFSEVERVLSSSKILISDRRNKLGDSDIQAVECLTSWPKAGLVKAEEICQVQELLVALEKKQAAGRWKEVEDLGVHVIEARKRVFGQVHPDSLTSMSSFACAMSEQGRWTEGEDLGAQVMEATKRVLGQDHPNTLASMHVLTSIQRRQRMWEEAEKLGVQVMEARKRVFGQDHQDSLASMNNFASTYGWQGKCQGFKAWSSMGYKNQTKIWNRKYCKQDKQLEILNHRSKQRLVLKQLIVL
ncbi:hypothetical protein BDD12DRAFT_893573 [Trichophaea hybrida]|nr:hypothetical protein BDD12DRAFT_893573 [Trichophaea hybrida]